MLEDIELNPIALAGGLLTGVLAIVVSSQVDTGIFMKAITFVVSAFVGYLVVSNIFSR